MVVYTMRVPIDEALNWELHKQTLRWELADRACDEARERGKLPLPEDEETATVRLDAETFVVDVEVLSAPETSGERGTMTTATFKMTEAEYREGEDVFEGRCIECGAVAYSVEPDARAYECDECGAKAVFGLQELLLMGLLDIRAS
jgi:hypothetical protein